ncbi:hypothetical protein KC906_00665 [Candidatus Kaiserbacteria bacterium]|nr:hypothetical protein [Candidatus Kaiserbacteria bacterium]
MGAGIAIDVAIATLARFHHTDLSFRNWTLPITITHIAFPAIGYFIFWGALAVGDSSGLQAFLGTIGGVLVVLLVYEVLAEATGHKPIFELSECMGKLLPLEGRTLRRFLAVLAVSWDALLSGPALAAQASAAKWTTGEVVGAILIAGLVVAAIAETALALTLQLRKRQSLTVEPYARFMFWGEYAELSVIGGFGILSIWHGWLGNGDIYRSVGLAAVIIGAVFWHQRHTIIATARHDAAVVLGT